MFGEKRFQENVNEPFTEGQTLGPIIKSFQDLVSKKDSLPDAIIEPIKRQLADAPVWSEIT